MRRAIALVLLVLSMGCAAPPPEPIAERFTGDVRPDPARKQALVTLTLAYWAALEGERWHQAYRYHTVEFQQEYPFETWLARVRGARHDTRRPVLIRWSRGAHRWQGPELYALLEWTVPDGPGGRLTWREDAPGRFLIEAADPL